MRALYGLVSPRRAQLVLEPERPDVLLDSYRTGDLGNFPLQGGWSGVARLVQGEQAVLRLPIHKWTIGYVTLSGRHEGAHALEARLDRLFREPPLTVDGSLKYEGGRALLVDEDGAWEIDDLSTLPGGVLELGDADQIEPSVWHWLREESERWRVGGERAGGERWPLPVVVAYSFRTISERASGDHYTRWTGPGWADGLDLGLQPPLPILFVDGGALEEGVTVDGYRPDLVGRRVYRIRVESGDDLVASTGGADRGTLMIEIDGLTKTYDKQPAVQALRFTVGQGEIFGFIGPNGAGKTTTLRMLATLLRPSEGTGRVCGFDIRTQPVEVRRRIGYLPDFFGVYEDMRVGDYLKFFAAAYGIPASKRQKVIDGVLELTDLVELEKSLIGDLSRGMQQRIALARCLVHDPPVLLLDEPASGLDPRARLDLLDILRELRRMGKTVLISSHILSELADVSDSFGILEKGRMVACGSLDELTSGMETRRAVVEIGGGRAPEAIEVLRGHPAVADAFLDEDDTNRGRDRPDASRPLDRLPGQAPGRGRLRALSPQRDQAAARGGVPPPDRGPCGVGRSMPSPSEDPTSAYGSSGLNDDPVRVARRVKVLVALVLTGSFAAGWWSGGSPVRTSPASVLDLGRRVTDDGALGDP